MANSHLIELETLRIQHLHNIESNQLKSSSRLIHDKVVLMNERDALIVRLNKCQKEVATTRESTRSLLERTKKAEEQMSMTNEESSSIKRLLNITTKELSVLREKTFHNNVDLAMEYEEKEKRWKIERTKEIRIDMEKREQEGK
jgi:hypothetical protein